MGGGHQRWQGGTPPVVLVAGPTASGKSDLAIRLAEALDGVVINADSMQVYRDLRILTACPSEADEARVPHRLYGVLDGADVCSAGRWREMAVGEVEAAHDAGRLPIVVGGTGFYLAALEHGLAELPDIPADVRREARASLARLGNAAFHDRLAERDPEMAARLSPGDSQRLVRAWEVLEATGRSLAFWQAEAGTGPPGWRFARIVLEPPRRELYAVADARFRRMVEAGALDEVRALAARGLDPAVPVMKAVGVPQLAAYLAGEADFETAVAEGQKATRHYVKRQLTWLRTQFPREDVATIVLSAQFCESLEGKIFNFIRPFLLTAS